MLKQHNIRWGLLLVIIAFLACSFAGKKPAFVMDINNVFTDSQVKALTSLYAAHERKTTNEIALITISDYAPEPTIAAYGVKKGKELGVGKKGKNNGVLITLCVPRHAVNISTGKGTEKVLKDEICGRIIDKIMTPEFKKGNYYLGIYKGSKEMIAILEKPGNEIK